MQHRPCKSDATTKQKHCEIPVSKNKKETTYDASRYGKTAAEQHNFFTILKRLTVQLVSCLRGTKNIVGLHLTIRIHVTYLIQFS